MTSKKIELKAQRRTLLGKKVKRSRARGLLPAVVYGHKLESVPVFVNASEFKKIYKEAGTSTLIDLVIDDDKAIKVLLHEPQIHYLRGEPIHADFYAVKMTEKIETAIPIHFVGASAAVEELGGNLVISRDELEIRCLPGDLIQSVEVDLSALATFDDVIRVSDLKVPEKIEILLDPNEVIATVAAPISEEELEAELTSDTSEAEAAAVEELGKEDAVAQDEAAETEPSEEKVG